LVSGFVEQSSDREEDGLRDREQPVSLLMAAVPVVFVAHGSRIELARCRQHIIPTA
jgi:hypothetical protein